MAVRVRLKLKSRISGEVVETVAPVNTGFETESPQLLTPLALAWEAITSLTINANIHAYLNHR